MWKFVGWHLAKNGIETILVGGAVAAIYSDGIYKSGDLDFVLKTYADGKLTEVMESTRCTSTPRPIASGIAWPRTFILRRENA